MIPNNYKMRIAINALICITVLFGACRKSAKSKSDFFQHVSSPESNLQIKQQVGDVETTLIFKSWQLMLQNRRGNKVAADSTLIRSLRDKYFFIFSLSAHHKE